MSPFGAIDSPAEDELVYQHGFQVRGWVHPGAAPHWHAVIARIAESVVGATGLRLPRPDVATNLGLDEAPFGFVISCTIAEHFRSAGSLRLAFDVVNEDGDRMQFAERTVSVSEIDYRIHSHAEVVTDAPARVLKRSDVYFSGPPSPVADPVCVDLISRYVLPGERILDVGCGVGAYADALIARGLHWSGCEAQSPFVDQMRARGLDAVLAVRDLPFADKSFDAAICIEVLEHVDEFEAFLVEIGRVTRRAALFSVPNFGAVPIASSMYALPYHMLEPDHKNFFTTRSLLRALEAVFRHVETFEYGPLDLFRSHDGIAINNHVFAVAEH